MVGTEFARKLPDVQAHLVQHRVAPSAYFGPQRELLQQAPILRDGGHPQVGAAEIHSDGVTRHEQKSLEHRGRCVLLPESSCRRDLPGIIVGALGGSGVKGLLLALRTIMSAPAADDDSLDRRFAYQARLSRALIRAQLELE